MKKKLIALISALLVCSLLAACGISSPSPSKIGTVTKEQISENTSAARQSTKASEPTAEKTTEATVKDIYDVGDIVEVSGRKIIYTACGEYISDSPYLQPGDGNKYIFLEFYVENVGNSSISVSYFDFDAYADGYAVDQKYFDEDALRGSLSPGRWNLGKVYFEIPADATEIEAEYEYNMISGKKLKFAYEGTKDSCFVPDAKTSPSNDTFKPGDIIETGKYRITYVSCDFFVSDNMFIEPEEGNEFIYLEFEIENTSDSDRSVSSLLFECYADGRICRSTSLRDDDLSATLSPGRKVKGTVAFQVPKDASVIEIEFQENLLSGKAAIFSFEK